MKKIFILLCMCICFSGCTSILLGMAIAQDSKALVTFKANGELFESQNAEIGSFRIFEVEGKGFAISFAGSEWDTENTFRDAHIGLNCGFFDGHLKKNEEYVFTTEDGLDAYPMFNYTVYEEIESTPESSVHRMHTIWFNASEGWFKITRLSEKDGTVSGKFSFTAVCDSPSSQESIEVTEGFFRNIPYVLVQDKSL